MISLTVGLPPKERERTIFLFDLFYSFKLFEIRYKFKIPMKLLRVLRSMVHHADFFSTTELIRYREEPDFKTFTGGIFSLAIIILLAVIFSSMSISAVNR